MAFVKESGVKFHWGEDGANDFDENRNVGTATGLPDRARPGERIQSRLRGLAVSARIGSAAAAIGFRRGSAQFRLPTREQRRLIITSTEGDQGNLVPMELMKRLLKTKGLHQAVMFHDVRWGADFHGRFLWVFLTQVRAEGTP